MPDLSRTLAIEELRRLHEDRRSGVFTVSAGDVTKGVFLRAGHIVFASSTDEGDKLGEALVRLGRISRAEFVAAFQAAQVPTRRRLGQALVSAGLMEEEELGRLVAHQVRTIVLSVCRFASGEAVFHEAADPIPMDLALELSTSRLLLEGARIFPDPDRLERALGRPGRKLRLSPNPPIELAAVTFTPAEQLALDGVADGLTVGEILGGPRPRVLMVRALYALKAGGLLEGLREETATVEIEVDTGTFRLAQAGPDPRPPAAAGDRVLRLYESLPHASLYEVLDVPPDSAPLQIEQAWKKQQGEHAEWKGLISTPRMASMVSTLHLRRQEAYRVLSDTARRQAYDQGLRGLPTAEAGHADRVRATRRAIAEGERLLVQGNVEEATVLLLETVRQHPRDAAAHRALALALVRHPRMARAAERHFLQALEIEPDDADLRYQLALYYRKAGLERRARSQLDAAVRSEPGHREARRALKAIDGEGGGSRRGT